MSERDRFIRVRGRDRRLSFRCHDPVALRPRSPRPNQILLTNGVWSGVDFLTLALAHRLFKEDCAGSEGGLWEGRVDITLIWQIAQPNMPPIIISTAGHKCGPVHVRARVA